MCSRTSLFLVTMILNSFMLIQAAHVTSGPTSTSSYTLDGCAVGYATVMPGSLGIG